MSRSKKNQRRDWRQIVFLVIALMVALTMVLAYVLPTVPSLTK